MKRYVLIAVLANRVNFQLLQDSDLLQLRNYLRMKFVSGETILANDFVVIQILRSMDAVILNFEYISLV